MSNKYYYLGASLPYLKLEEGPPITKEGFLSECTKWLNPADLTVLSNLNEDGFKERAEDPDVIKEWKRFDLALRRDLAQVREARKKSLYEKVPPSVSAILDGADPLLMEKRIARKRWNFLEEKELGNYFDRDVLLLYFLRLQILERLSRFSDEKGEARFEEACEVRYD